MDLLNKLNDDTSWNTLFLNPNSVLAAISNKFAIKKVTIKKTKFIYF